LSAIGCQPEAVSPIGTDLLLGWQVEQPLPHTRAFQLQQIINSGGDISNQTVLVPGSTTPNTLAFRFGFPMYATDYGVKADAVISSPGVVTGTSNDIAVAAALAACTSNGSTLIWPPGEILMNGAAQGILQNCAQKGAGVPASVGLNNPGGTTFLFTSTTIAPFICGTSWSISGVNYYWPQQLNGTTIYPPLISDNGSAGCNHASFDHNTIINAYDGFSQTSGTGWGDFKISDNTMYAVHGLYNLSNTGDSFALSNNRYTPGPWLGVCGSSTACETAIDAGIAVNAIYRVNSGGPVTVSDQGFETEGWRYSVLINAGGLVAGSSFHGAWDGIGTLIDASASGAVWAPGQIFSGTNALCATAVFGGPSPVGQHPCFNMGNGSQFTISNFSTLDAAGSFVVLTGGVVTLQNVTVAGLGGIADGDDYYAVSALSGAPIIIVQNSAFSGTSGNVHVHGISTATNVPLATVIQNNQFIYLNDDISVQSSSNQPTVITGNTSQVTAGTASISVRGSNGVIYHDNAFDVPPNSVPSACGTGPVAHGAFSGYVQVGTGGVTQCTITLPWMPYGYGAGSCQFALAGGTTTANGGPASGVVWTATFGASVGATQMFFNCPGQQ
jgi:hypothetical protein